MPDKRLAVPKLPVKMTSVIVRQAEIASMGPMGGKTHGFEVSILGFKLQASSTSFPAWASAAIAGIGSPRTRTVGQLFIPSQCCKRTCVNYHMNP